ncbi:MAG TPA: hypothetical protein VJ957_09185 [Longimicrobiales bacterium]|nr:hypothetical protein [Longimicrobiales bacterium]
MSFRIRRVDYYYHMVEDVPGEAYKLLSNLAGMGVNLLAFTAVPMGPSRTQFSLFPEDGRAFEAAARKAGMQVDGPHRALLVQGDDELGALAGLHEKLYRARVNVYASNSVSDGAGNYGYLLYVRPEDYQRAVEALEV